MAWLSKRPQVTLPVNYFTTGQSSTVIIAGLGNPEPQFEQTRHNIGFKVVDHFISKHEEMSPWVEKKDLKCHFSSGRIGDVQVIAIKPQTYMNLSGESLALVKNFYKTELKHIAVIHDELDIKFGDIRIRYGGDDAGHNGIKSINKAISEDYGRIRIGIGPKTPPQIDSADFVLAKFNEAEQKQMPNLLRESLAILSEFVYSKTLLSETRNFIV